MLDIRPCDPIFGRRVIQMEVDLDEETLTKIALLTEGRYFRATNKEELMEIYDQIDELERTKIESQSFTNYTDRFPWFVLPALGVFLTELVLAQSLLREWP